MKKEVVEKIFDSFKQDEFDKSNYGDRNEITRFYKNIRCALFLNCYFENRDKELLEKYLEDSKEHLKKFFGKDYKNQEDKIEEIYDNLPQIKEMLMLDVEAIFDGDPAANSYKEIILTYPGFVAISVYRIAHEFYKRGLTFVSRVLSEYAHGKTGVDINAGAKIGKYFFIDHGTGIVIGETAEIGDHVKLYQGVTIGALSLRDGQALKGKKRHPTILNNVTIYSGASIFGGETIIGNNVILGSNVFITESIPDNTVCRLTPCGMEKREK
ncbi:MAG: serine acetyltransferase [Bacilli bacterium]|nr:serine acetyltransferase [Bacilli bacterium]